MGTGFFAGASGWDGGEVGEEVTAGRGWAPRVAVDLDLGGPMGLVDVGMGRGKVWEGELSFSRLRMKAWVCFPKSLAAPINSASI